MSDDGAINPGETREVPAEKTMKESMEVPQESHTEKSIETPVATEESVETPVDTAIKNPTDEPIGEFTETRAEEQSLVLEPDFLEEERESLLILFLHKAREFLMENPSLLKRAIAGLALIIIVLIALMLFLPDPRLDIVEKALYQEKKTGDTVYTDSMTVKSSMVDGFSGIGIKIQKPSDLLLQPLQVKTIQAKLDGAKAMEENDLLLFAHNNFYYQKLLFDLYEYDLTGNAANTPINKREELYQVYINQLSKALGETKTIVDLIRQKNSRLVVEFKQTEVELKETTRKLNKAFTNSSHSLTQSIYQLYASQLEAKLATLAEQTRQLGAFEDRLIQAYQFANQRLISAVVNKEALLANISVDYIANDNLGLVSNVGPGQIQAGKMTNATDSPFAGFYPTQRVGLMGQPVTFPRANLTAQMKKMDIKQPAKL